MPDKMTPEKTIAHIEEILSEVPNYDESLDYELSSCDFDWLEEAKKAVEKMIPKKPNESCHQDYFWCNDCNRIIKKTIENSKIIIRYCPFCGQALDWSEGKDGAENGT